MPACLPACMAVSDKAAILAKPKLMPADLFCFSLCVILKYQQLKNPHFSESFSHMDLLLRKFRNQVQTQKKVFNIRTICKDR